MSYEDKSLVCSQCGKEFTFSAGEQEFHAQKGFTSDPKRCKPCRIARRQKNSNTGGAIYRSPAFENSAPSHQKIRGRHGRSNWRHDSKGRGEHGSDRPAGHREYRSPAFRDYNVIKPDQEYRAPAFRELEAIDPKEEYRSPGFQEYANLKAEEEYRAPGYRNTRERHHDEKPMFSIVCGSCGKESMIPFLPEEKDDPLCQECFAKFRREQTKTEDL